MPVAKKCVINLIAKTVKITNSEVLSWYVVFAFYFWLQRSVRYTSHSFKICHVSLLTLTANFIVCIGVGRCRALCHPRFDAMVISSSAILNLISGWFGCVCAGCCPKSVFWLSNTWLQICLWLFWQIHGNVFRSKKKR